MFLLSESYFPKVHKVATRISTTEFHLINPLVNYLWRLIMWPSDLKYEIVPNYCFK